MVFWPLTLLPFPASTFLLLKITKLFPASGPLHMLSQPLGMLVLILSFHFA